MLIWPPGMFGFHSRALEAASFVHVVHGVKQISLLSAMCIPVAGTTTITVGMCGEGIDQEVSHELNFERLLEMRASEQKLIFFCVI